jgi:hypothetical protein
MCHFVSIHQSTNPSLHQSINPALRHPIKKLEGFLHAWRIMSATKHRAMKKMKVITGTLLAVAVLGASLLALAADKPAETKIKPYTLKVCVVSGDKLGEMGKPFVFTNDTREIKLCCKSCLKDFKKDPEKYIKKIEQAEAKAKKDKADKS